MALCSRYNWLFSVYSNAQNSAKAGQLIVMIESSQKARICRDFVNGVAPEKACAMEKNGMLFLIKKTSIL